MYKKPTTNITLFENESITDINYPDLLAAFYHNLNKEKKSSS